jgi:hypothetical protein
MSSKLFYFFSRGLILFLTPVILILLSFVWALTTPELHQTTLARSNIYPRISQASRKLKIATTKDPRFFDLVLVSLNNQVINPGWIQNFSERNIVNFTLWLKGDKDKLQFYFPIKDLEGSLSNEMDRQIQELINSKNSRVCSQKESIEIKNKGFNLFEKICIPEKVYQKKQSFSAFLLEDKTKNTSLISFVTDEKLNINQNEYSVDLINNSSFWQTFRDFTIFVRTSFWYILGILVLLYGGLLFWAWRLKMYVLREARFLGWSVVTSTLLVVITTLVFVSLSGFLSKYIDNFLDTNILNNQIYTLISELFLRIIFNLFLISIIISLVVLFWVLATWFGEKFLKFSNYDSKNQKLKDHSIDYSNGKNETIDSQFHRMRNSPIEPAPMYQNPLPQVNINYYPIANSASNQTIANPSSLENSTYSPSPKTFQNITDKPSASIENQPNISTSEKPPFTNQPETQKPSEPLISSKSKPDSKTWF